MDTLAKLGDALRILHAAIGEPATARHLQIFIAIAAGKLNTPPRLATALGLSGAAVHRAIGRVGDGYLDGRQVRQPGAGLVMRGYQTVHLTPTGLTVVQAVQAALAEVEWVPPPPVIPAPPPSQPYRRPRKIRAIQPKGIMVHDFDDLVAMGFEVTRPAAAKRSPHGGHMPGTRAMQIVPDNRHGVIVEITQGPRRGVRWRVRVRTFDAKLEKPFHHAGFGTPGEGEAYTATEAAAAALRIAEKCQ